MRTIEVKLYQYDELSEEAQAKAVDSLSDINVDYDWWDSIYEDASIIGLTITGFDLYRRECDGQLTESLQDVCKLILENHGASCETYQLALEWQHKHGEDNEQEFLTLLLSEYLSMLQQQLDYETSEEAIIETIRLNEYDFTEDGTLS